jgi:hypothetical protein
MANTQLKSGSRISFILLLLAAAILSSAACKSQEQKAFQTVQDHVKVKDPELKDVKLVLFHTSPNFPSKAYLSISGTRGFATSDGKAQTDYIGFILEQEGGGWKVAQDRNIQFTKDAQDAERYLAGRK